jgi:hypothetical protein
MHENRGMIGDSGPDAMPEKTNKRAGDRRKTLDNELEHFHSKVREIVVKELEEQGKSSDGECC